jgi:predicted O-methyltransferase YrrM
MAGDLLLPQRVYDYLISVSLREPPILKRLREETAGMPRATMQVPPEHGQFMAFLVQLLQVRSALEVGVFTGYSSLSVAMALPEDGRIVACDISEEFTSVARRYWKEAGVEQKIELHIRPAIETLRELLAQGRQNTFDFAFIDADKISYAQYYDCALELIRPGGAIMVDNVLWSGRVADPKESDADTVALRAFNEKVHSDTRVFHSLLPLGDGVTLALKR